ncbi:MAG TPA: CD225/dispanin family protein [Actinomycetota bacterium]|nr:CD225/dispanin family protein [Actinomycetota bacterium]
MPHAILSTLLCCMPFGIVSIVFAAQVNSKVAAGDQQGARESSANAKKWAIISAVLGILPWGFFLLMFMGGMATSSFGP